MSLASLVTDGREVADELAVVVSAALGAVKHADTGLHEDCRIVVVAVAHAPGALVPLCIQTRRVINAKHIPIWPIFELGKLYCLQITGFYAFWHQDNTYHRSFDDGMHVNDPKIAVAV